MITVELIIYGERKVGLDENLSKKISQISKCDHCDVISKMVHGRNLLLYINETRIVDLKFY